MNEFVITDLNDNYLFYSSVLFQNISYKLVQSNNTILYENRKKYLIYNSKLNNEENLNNIIKENEKNKILFNKLKLKKDNFDEHYNTFKSKVSANSIECINNYVSINDQNICKNNLNKILFKDVKLKYLNNFFI